MHNNSLIPVLRRDEPPLVVDWKSGQHVGALCVAGGVVIRVDGAETAVEAYEAWVAAGCWLHMLAPEVLVGLFLQSWRVATSTSYPYPIDLDRAYTLAALRLADTQHDGAAGLRRLVLYVWEAADFGIFMSGSRTLERALGVAWGDVVQGVAELLARNSRAQFQGHAGRLPACRDIKEEEDRRLRSEAAQRMRAAAEQEALDRLRALEADSAQRIAQARSPV